MPPEENKPPEPTQGAAPESNGASNAEDLAVIKAELEQEKKAIAAARTMIQEKDAAIAQLQAEAEALKAEWTTFKAAADELVQVKDAHSKAVTKYLSAVKLANPAIPGDVITGGSIDEIDASVARALSIATAVKASLEAQAKQAKVPAGAPTRGEISLEGLSPREKIAAGIQQKGGAQ
jgi:chromosome segregation ATPase